MTDMTDLVLTVTIIISTLLVVLLIEYVADLFGIVPPHERDH